MQGAVGQASVQLLHRARRENGVVGASDDQNRQVEGCSLLAFFVAVPTVPLQPRTLDAITFTIECDPARSQPLDLPILEGTFGIGDVRVGWSASRGGARSGGASVGIARARVK